MKVAVNARIAPQSGTGGIETFLIALLSALGDLDGPEKYIVVAPRDNTDWLLPYLGSNQKIVTPPMPTQERNGRITRFMLRTLRRPVTLLVKREFGIWPQVPISEGFYESLGCEVLHFPFQHYTLCSIPSVYNPHDLQHLHYPQYFTPDDIAWREVHYRTGCQVAHRIVVASQSVKDDIVTRYAIHPSKIQVVPWAPPTSHLAVPTPQQVTSIRSLYSLPETYALYPAMTWPHKNHAKLLEAIARLRETRNVELNFVCTGHKTSHWTQLESITNSLNLDQQVQFLGLVPSEHLKAIYRGAAFVFVPTLFEAASGPVFEAWKEGCPVACSNVTSLPQQAGDAALLFDPTSLDSMVDALYQMATSDDLRQDLMRRGAKRLGEFSWERTAKAYRAVYRSVARKSLTPEDRHLLAWDWMSQDDAVKGVEA